MVESLALQRVAGGWCVVVLHTQGLRVVDTEILAGPDPRAVANEQLKIAVVRRMLSPRN